MKFVLVIALAVLCLTRINVHGATPPSKDVSALLAPIIQKHDVPGMAAAVVRNSEVVAIGPAGIVHCSIGDWAKFVAANFPSAKTKLVKPETLEKIHTPAPGEPKYAMGWIIADGQPWADGPALTHAGSNTMWYAVAWPAPKKDCNDAVLALIADHFKSEGR